MWWMECLCELCSSHLHSKHDPGTVWSCSKDSKANLVHQLCITLLSLAIPPFMGDGQMTNKYQKFIYEHREEISYPPVFAPVWGDIAHFFFFFFFFWGGGGAGGGGYWPILPSIMGKNGEISHLCCLPESHIPTIAHGSICSFIHLYQSYSCRAACQVLDKSNLSQLRASSKLIPTARHQSSLSSSSDIHYTPRTINAYFRYHICV